MKKLVILFGVLLFSACDNSAPSCHTKAEIYRAQDAGKTQFDRLTYVKLMALSNSCSEIYNDNKLRDKLESDMINACKAVIGSDKQKCNCLKGKTKSYLDTVRLSKGMCILAKASYAGGYAIESARELQRAMYYPAFYECCLEDLDGAFWHAAIMLGR